MLQNIDISDAQLTVGDYLAADSNIKDFCQTNFGKPPTIYTGEFLRKHLPAAADCPYIVIYGFTKREGLNVQYCRYRCTIAVGVSGKPNAGFVENDTGVKILDAYDVCAKLMTLIQQELNKRMNGTRPLAICESEGPGPITPNGDHWAGVLKCQWHIYQTIGTSTVEKF